MQNYNETGSTQPQSLSIFDTRDIPFENVEAAQPETSKSETESAKPKQSKVKPKTAAGKEPDGNAETADDRKRHTPEEIWAMIGYLTTRLDLTELVTLTQMYKLINHRSGAKSISETGLAMIQDYLNSGADAASVSKETRLLLHRLDRGRGFTTRFQNYIPQQFHLKILNFMVEQASDIEALESAFKALKSVKIFE